MHPESYSAYLRSPHWRAFRASVVSSNPQCMVCGSVERLEVNHMRYDTLGDESPLDVVVLCRAHHSAFHSRLQARHWSVLPRYSWRVYRDMQIAYSDSTGPRSRGWLRRLFRLVVG